MIDLHCHLLPAIDDGAGDFGEALSMAQMQVRQGVRTVAATPHVRWDIPNDAARIQRAVEEMRVALRAADIPLELTIGAEVDIERALDASEEELAGLSLGGGPWLLLEAPLHSSAPLELAVERLLMRGHSILLAHPERSPQLRSDPALLARLVRFGVRTQVTTGGLSGQFGRSAQRFAGWLVDEGLMHTLASDAHDTVSRPPGMVDPLTAAGLGAHSQLVCDEYPAAVLAGESIPALVPLRRQRRRGRWR